MTISTRHVRIAALLLALCGCFASFQSRAEVIISEIMYDPQSTDTNREWIEIFNTDTSNAVSLNGWQIGLPSNNDWATLPNVSIGPKQALVLTPSTATLDSDWGSGINRVQVSNFPPLTNSPNGNTADAKVEIRNASLVMQDQITYEDGSGWPTTNGNDGNSIYVLPQFLSSSGNNSGGNWKPSSQGLYGAVWKSAGGASENHASPGTVATEVQADFVPSPDAAWSMVYLPDVQNYNSSDGDHAREILQMNWILANKTSWNIKAVIQGGDIVNQNQSEAQWGRAKVAFHMLDGQVPYILAAGNHDFGTTNFQSRTTNYNDYFKITDNALNNGKTGTGIVKGTYEPVGSEQFTHLENSYSTFTAPDGRKMLIFNLEYYPRQAVLNWADGIAGQAQFADYTAVLLTHSFIGSGNTRWSDSYPIEGNDGVEMWNELVKVNGNFEMTFNGHLGGDGNGYRVDANNAGVDVQQMFLNTQFETNGGNGWLRVVEFLKDGQSVRVRTYSPHFELYRTNSASNLDFAISHVDSPLIWNTGSDSFTNGFARSNGNLGVGVTVVDPYGAGGKEDLIVGFNGVASITGSASRTVGSLRVGTNAANAVISGRNGNGTATISNSTNLTLSSSTSTGDLTVGEGGFTGTLNWNSSGTLTAQGKLRVGQGGVGIFNQNAGVVIGGNTSGSLKFLAVGAGAGSQGTYNLNAGTLRPSGGFAGTEFRQLAIGDTGATGEINVGDGAGAAAAIESNDDLYIGRDGGVGLMRVRSDGRVELRTSSNAAEFFVGQDSVGTVLQTGGTVQSDNTVRIGSEPDSIGKYTISAGSLSTATDDSGTFTIGRNGGQGTLRVEGTGQVVHKAELYLGEVANGSKTSGRLEIIGNTVGVQIAKLENAAGVREAIFWQASPGGISPLIVTGTNPASANPVKLQDVVAGTVTGDGIALELDLSAITTSQILTLINNGTDLAITGLFEQGTSTNLYSEGEVILGTGFDGTVTISYHGGTGNDVTLNLVALLGDYDRNGKVDAADYLVWRKTGTNGQQGYDDWRRNLGKTAPSFSPLPGELFAAEVPEPATWVAIVMGIALLSVGRSRIRKPASM